MYRLSHYTNIHLDAYIQIIQYHSVLLARYVLICSARRSRLSQSYWHIGLTSPNAEVQRESTRVWHPRRHGAGERSLQNARQSRSLPEPDCCPICTRSGSCCKRINHPTVLKQDTFSKGGWSLRSSDSAPQGPKRVPEHKVQGRHGDVRVTKKVMLPHDSHSPKHCW